MMATELDFNSLIKRVIGQGLCTACGTCVGACPARCIDFDSDTEEPVLIGECIACGTCLAVCPGRDIPLPQIEERFLGRTRTNPDDFLGVYSGLYCGYAADPALRRKAASGGTTTALLRYSLSIGMIDGAVVVGTDREHPWRAKPFVARTQNEIEAAAKSKYVLCPANKTLSDAEEFERLAVVGLPCHVHGLRKIQMAEGLTDLAQRIVMVLGLYCGSNVSFRVIEHVIEELAGVPLSEVIRFEYRGGPKAQDTKIWTRDGREITILNSARLATYLWLQHDRCRMCCDWTAEAADLSLGDIFYPPTSGAWQKVPNWNSLIVRNSTGQNLLDSAVAAGAIYLEPINEQSFYGNIGYESKKHGAVYKLNRRKRFGWPTPEYGYNFNFVPRPREWYPVPDFNSH